MNNPKCNMFENNRTKQVASKQIESKAFEIKVANLYMYICK